MNRYSRPDCQDKRLPAIIHTPRVADLNNFMGIALAAHTEGLRGVMVSSQSATFKFTS